MVAMFMADRLIPLPRFFVHIFPMLPVVSHSHFGVTSVSPIPHLGSLEQVPVHLLAAVYASSLPYISGNEQLSMWDVRSIPSAKVLWKFVQESLAEQTDRPQLSVIQASLLYLHKAPMRVEKNSASDTLLVWSFLGSTVGLAASLGLYVECQMWNIPPSEKRLRRRLWWALYAEDKWRALLTGRPPYLHSEDWNVGELQGSDFTSTLDHEAGKANPFWHFVQLASIAEDIQVSL